MVLRDRNDKLYKWVEDGYIWYSEIGMIKAEYTVKTYFSDELKKKMRYR